MGAPVVGTIDMSTITGVGFCSAFTADSSRRLELATTAFSASGTPSAIPEPSTSALIGLILGGFGWFPGDAGNSLSHKKQAASLLFPIPVRCRAGSRSCAGSPPAVGRNHSLPRESADREIR